jgi:hypothetical protein
MVCMLEGTVTLHEGTATALLGAGDVATFKAGTPIGHFLENTGPTDARSLVIGTRSARDVVTYPDHDRVLHLDGAQGTRSYTDLAGTPADSPYTGLIRARKTLPRNAKGRPKAAITHKSCKTLLDLAFLVFDMLTLDRVIFAHGHLLGHGAGILLGHIEVPGARRRVQTDLDRRRLRHSRLSCIGETPLPREILEARLLRQAMAESTRKRAGVAGKCGQRPHSLPHPHP